MKNTHILAEEPFDFRIWLGKVRFKRDLLIFAFLSILINQWFQERICFLNVEKQTLYTKL